MNTVFPYIVLGSLFGASAGGRSLIKFAFIATRRLRGGPAHAAIVSTASNRVQRMFLCLVCQSEG
ncbi:MAG: hypothetical protein MI810_18935, partial [Flavobacteriales bacterium]|nr:hypothetical protein [Flavobacteriales bacterium]